MSTNYRTPLRTRILVAIASVCATMLLFDAVVSLGEMQAPPAHQQLAQATTDDVVR